MNELYELNETELSDINGGGNWAYDLGHYVGTKIREYFESL